MIFPALVEDLDHHELFEVGQLPAEEIAAKMKKLLAQGQRLRRGLRFEAFAIDDSGLRLMILQIISGQMSAEAPVHGLGDD